MRQAPYDQATLDRVLRGLHLDLIQEELRLVLVEYDPSGQARELDIEELEKDYREVTGKDYARAEYGHRQDMYSEFSSYWQQHGRGGPPPTRVSNLNNTPPPLPPPAPAVGRLRADLQNVASRCQEEL